MYTEKANQARKEGTNLVNSHDNASENEQKLLSLACIFDGTPKSALFFCMNKMLFHLVARCCEAAQQKKSSLKVINRTEGNMTYPCICFHVERHKTATMQDMQVFTHKSSYLMCLYFSLAYQMVLDEGDDDSLFPEFATKLGNDGDNKIDSKTSNLFNDYYKQLVVLSNKFNEEGSITEGSLPSSRTSHSLGKKGTYIYFYGIIILRTYFKILCH